MKAGAEGLVSSCLWNNNQVFRNLGHVQVLKAITKKLIFFNCGINFGTKFRKADNTHAKVFYEAGFINGSYYNRKTIF
jgi:hypothetical protein